MSPMRAVRGAAMVETAMVMTTTLLMLFGIIQIGVIGFLQMACDGAAFIAAREYANGNTSTYTTVTKRPFPRVGTVAVNQYKPDASSVPVNFQESSIYTRVGGASLVQGSHLEATVHASAPSGALGVGIASLSNVDVHGTTIEPQNQFYDDIYDVDAAGYTGSANGVNIFSGSTSQALENTPMYYVSEHRLAVCTQASFTATNCPAQSVVLLSLGTAEFLDFDNWNRPNLGVGPYSSTNLASYTFGEMLCHQQQYALAAQNVFKSGSLPSSSSLSTTNVSGPIGVIYSWDVSFSRSFIQSTQAMGYDSTLHAYTTLPLTPGANC
jgi:hypothetical protein